MTFLLQPGIKGLTSDKHAASCQVFLSSLKIEIRVTLAKTFKLFIFESLNVHYPQSGGDNFSLTNEKSAILKSPDIWKMFREIFLAIKYLENFLGRTHVLKYLRNSDNRQTRKCLKKHEMKLRTWFVKKELF